jgi:hypothetical protein
MICQSWQKTVGSNFFLLNRRLSVSFKKGGFETLAAGRGVASTYTQRLSNSCRLALVEYVMNYYKEQLVANLSYITQPVPALAIAKLEDKQVVIVVFPLSLHLICAECF